MTNKTLLVKCPNCKTEFNYYESATRPFCSDRCQKIDLGHWFNESYVVPLKEVAVELDEETNSKEYNNEEDEDSQYQ